MQNSAFYENEQEYLSYSTRFAAGTHKVDNACYKKLNDFFKFVIAHPELPMVEKINLTRFH